MYKSPSLILIWYQSLHSYYTRFVLILFFTSTHRSSKRLIFLIYFSFLLFRSHLILLGDNRNKIWYRLQIVKLFVIKFLLFLHLLVQFHTGIHKIYSCIFRKVHLEVFNPPCLIVSHLATRSLHLSAHLTTFVLRHFVITARRTFKSRILRSWKMARPPH